MDINSRYNCEICLIGDWNSKTGTECDFIPLDSTIAVNTGLENDNEIFLSEGKLKELGIAHTRNNSDKKVDIRGERLIELCKSLGLLIVNGRVGRDRLLGRTTCEQSTKQGISKSTIDYATASYTLFKYILDFHVDIFDKTLSDVHCPISITLANSNTCSPYALNSTTLPQTNHSKCNTNNAK